MQAHASVSFLDCLFTSASAVCVTGLITVDTAAAWSPWGQAVILLLLQLGGLGIMTFSAAMLSLTGRGPGLAAHMALRGALGPAPGREMGRLTRNLVFYTLILEAAGALILTLRFMDGRPLLEALALGGFHSVSAFCNAGFSLFSNSLENYAADPVVNLTIMALVVLCGLGFLVLREVAARLRPGRRRRPRRLSLHSRLVLVTSAVLIFGGAALIWLLEYLSGGQPGVWSSLFNSVTARTAGFSTVPMEGLSNAAILVMMFLMFVGASPGSTGGGVKTSALASLFALARIRLRGRPGAEAQGRSISDKQVGEALTLVLASAGVVMLAVLALTIYETDQVVGHQRGEVLTLAFEAVSAFATVGLSMGATATLGAAGKITLIILMYLGRLGPLTFMYALVKKSHVRRLIPAEERIMLG